MCLVYHEQDYLGAIEDVGLDVLLKGLRCHKEHSLKLIQLLPFLLGEGPGQLRYSIQGHF